MSLYYVCFRLHVSAVKRPSSGLYRASHVKYNGFGIKSTVLYMTSGFGGLEVACWPLVPKFAGSNPAEAVGFFRAKKSSVGPML